MTPGPAAQAREAAGFTIEEAAKRARVCVAYLRRIERNGSCSFPLAMRLSRLYQCSANVFLYHQGSEKPTKQASSRQAKAWGASPANKKHA
jgi:transcriptional regulator with XRE-family HTH domain